MENYRPLRSYVLRSGRMSGAQRRSYDSLSARFCVRPDRVLDLAEVFGRARPVIAEIGFGMGEAAAAFAGAHREINYLGLEVHRPGIGRLLWEIETQGLENVRIIEGDAAETLKFLGDESLAGLHLFFPDPWPKKRHRKRRLVARPFTETLAAKLAPGGYLYMVTDWADYADQALAELGATGGLENPCGGFAPPRDWRPTTRFEEKGLAKGHEIREIYFLKTLNKSPASATMPYHES